MGYDSALRRRRQPLIEQDSGTAHAVPAYWRLWPPFVK